MMLGIYEIVVPTAAWDIPNMATRSGKKESAQASALAIAERLSRLLGSGSERQWTKDAGVSPSFFSNLRGTPTKPPSDPSVDQLRQVLGAKGVSLSEFFLPEAEGKVMRVPTTQAVEKAFADALGTLPSRAADRPRYLAEVVAGVLGLPEGLPATQNDQDQKAEDDRVEAVPPRAATSGK
jgi:hypothetical protein